jgi:hypothetical protein
MSELHIIVKPDGTVEIDAIGYSGTKCLEVTQGYEKDLGAIINRKKKPEIYSGEEVNEVNNDNRNKNRTVY